MDGVRICSNLNEQSLHESSLTVVAVLVFLQLRQEVPLVINQVVQFLELPGNKN